MPRLPLLGLVAAAALAAYGATLAPRRPRAVPTPPPPLVQERWTPAEWANAPDHALPNLRANVVWEPARAVSLVLDGVGETQLVRNGPICDSGVYSFSFVVPRMHEGQDAAVFLYEHATHDEVDVEVVGRRGLQLNVHHGGREFPVWPQGFRGDLSGRTITGSMRIDGGGSVVWRLNGEEALRLGRKDTGATGLPTARMQFIFANETVTKSEPWIGRWTPLRPGERSVMRVLGFSYAPLEGQPGSPAQAC